MMISIIAAIGKNRELGKDNKLIWHIPEDLKRFHDITLGHPIIMGRKTFESIGRPLPNRTNIVVTRNTKYKIHDTKDIMIVQSLEEAIVIGKKIEQRELFIIGGGQIFEQAIKIADKIYLTIIDKEFKADTFFPDYSEFKKVVFKKHGQSNAYQYTFLELEK